MSNLHEWHDTDLPDLASQVLEKAETRVKNAQRPKNIGIAGVFWSI